MQQLLEMRGHYLRANTKNSPRYITEWKKLRYSAVYLIYHHLCKKKKKEGISLHVYTTLCIVYKFYVLKNSYYTVLRYAN